MSDDTSLHIGIPYNQFMGMNRTMRRGQMAQNFFYMLKNVDLLGDALRRRPGMVRLLSGARPAVSRSADGAAATYVDIPTTDVSAIAEYDLGPRWTLFVSFSVSALATMADVFLSDTVANSPGIAVYYKTDGSLSATVIDADANTDTLESGAAAAITGEEIRLRVTRNGSTITMYVDGVQVATSTGTLSATADTKAPGASMFLASDNVGATAPISYYEVRLHREVLSSAEWDFTQYPWTGVFGDKNLILHLLFEEGAGIEPIDFSRIQNASITYEGAWTRNASTLRQVAVPVTGIHIKENTVGRKWILCDIGVNHYRIPFN